MTVELRSLPSQTELLRRGRAAGRSHELLERGAELAVIRHRLTQAANGRGSVVFIEGQAGHGKSRLLGAVGEMARGQGMQVLRAGGRELERDFPFGVAIQLFEPLWAAASETSQARLASGPARSAADLLAGLSAQRAPDLGDGGFGIIRGLFWLASNLTRSGNEDAATPLALIVDDAHDCDPASLRALTYLAERVSGLPIMLAVAAQPDESSPNQPALAALRGTALEGHLRPAALSGPATETLVASVFRDADASFREACVTVTGGNPFLVVELLHQLGLDEHEPTAATAERLGQLAPESVRRAVARRLRAMPEAARALAEALAVLGTAAPLRRILQIAEIDVETATPAADKLISMGMLRSGESLEFVHPLVRSAVRGSISPVNRSRLHLNAARLLLDEPGSQDAIAEHLLGAPADADPRVVELLRTVARESLSKGLPQPAVQLLRRALAEPPTPACYPDVLAELAQAESLAGLPRAVERLEDAISVIDESPQRARLALMQGSALYDLGRFSDAAHVLASIRDQSLDDPALADELEATYVAAALYVPDLSAEARALGSALANRLGEQATRGQRHALALLAEHESLRNAHRDEVRHLANLASAGAEPLHLPDGHRSDDGRLARALLFADELERGREICAAALRQAGTGASSLGRGQASLARAWIRYERGEITGAADDARVAIDLLPAGADSSILTGEGARAACHVHRGELDLAERILAGIERRDDAESSLPSLLDIRAQLRLAQARPREALRDGLAAGRLWTSHFGADCPGALAWRSTVGLAHIVMGETRFAARLVSQELDDARSTGLTRVVIRCLRILGLARGGPSGIELLSQAVAEGDSYPPRLEHIKALVDLGAALRRGNQRAAARPLLRRALELSESGGATLIAERARAELESTGARARGVLLIGIDSLTASERRVAGLAARGLTTRQMSESLFVTAKTIEFHLRNIYQKLDVHSRAELAEALARRN
jgi:DNA-binding CsgD family transcriptional regulator